jgi:hypothetical protein
VTGEAGYYALKMTKECGLSEKALKKTFMGIVKRLDDSRKHGRTRGLRVRGFPLNCVCSTLRETELPHRR